MTFNDYLTHPFDKLKVLIVGIGGTGSKVSIHSARISHSLRELEKLPLDLILCDDDIVEPYNIGRQNFYPTDLGLKKSESMAQRLFESYNIPVHSIEEQLTESMLEVIQPNIIISCVDNMRTRYLIDNYYTNHEQSELDDRVKLHLWIDTGNESSSGQIFVTDFNTAPSFTETYGIIEENLNTPSCSMAESLAKQDLFVNDYSAIIASQTLWTILTDLRISYNTKQFNTLKNKVI